MWKGVFQDLSSGKIKANYRSNQTGRGLGGRYASTFQVPVSLTERRDSPVQQVSQTAAVVERAKNTLKREKRFKIPHIEQYKKNQ